MKRVIAHGSGVVMAWGLILAVLWIVGWAVFDMGTTAIALGGWTAGSVLFWAGFVRWREARAGRPADDEPGAVVDGSHATALLGIAITGGLLSTVFGPWLAYVSLGAALVAIGGLVREHRASRATLDAIRRRQESA